jgi:hypothetical protein
MNTFNPAPSSRFHLAWRKRLDIVTTFVEKLLIIRGDACQEMCRHPLPLIFSGRTDLAANAHR